MTINDGMALLLRRGRWRTRHSYTLTACFDDEKRFQERGPDQALSYHLFSNLRFLPNLPKLPAPQRNEIRTKNNIIYCVLFYNYSHSHLSGAPNPFHPGYGYAGKRIGLGVNGTMTKWDSCHGLCGTMQPRQNDGMMAPETHCEFLPTFLFYLMLLDLRAIKNGDEGLAGRLVMGES